MIGGPALVIHAPAPRLVTIDAVELFLRVFAGKEGAGELPPGTNRGPYITRILAVTKLVPPEPWCAAEVADAGSKAFGKAWPLPLTASCQQLADFGRMRKVLYTRPQRGDLWLRWHINRFGHVGAVLSASPDEQHVEVQAGNTILPAQAGNIREGWINAKRTEVIAPEDRFLRWVELLATTSV